METNENIKTPLELLLEAIDYSFLKTDGTYDESLTMPVIDKVQWIKGLIIDARAKEQKRNMEEAVFKEEFPFTFDELKDNGVRVGDVVAAKFLSSSKNINYFLLRKGFPEDFNTSLCCSCFDDDDIFDMSLYQIGFHYVGAPTYRFRKTTEEERQAFIKACTRALHEPIKKDENGHVWGWDEDHYAQILGHMVRDGLITEYKGKKLSAELEKIHGVDLFKLYKMNYGFLK